MRTELPDGWSIIRVSDYFDSWGGMTPSTGNAGYWGGDVPWVSSRDVKAWRIAAGGEFITRKALEETRLRLCPIGSVLVVVRSGILAHTLPIAVVDAPVSINQDIKAFHCPNHNLNEWLALALRALSPEILTNNRKDGTTVQSVRYDELCDLTIHVPPSHEQRRITARIGDLLRKVDSARDHLSRVPAILKRFRQAVLAAACSGRLTEDWRNKRSDLTPVSRSIEGILRQRRETFTRNHGTDKKYLPPKELETDLLPVLPDGWKYVSSDVLFSFVTSGSRGWAQYYADVGPIFVRIGNLDHGSIELDLSDVQRVRPPKGLEQKRTALREGDILISITADVGMIGLVPAQFGVAHINQHIALARPVDPWYTRYLAWYLASEAAQAQFQALQRGATKVGLGLEDIKSVSIPFPPWEEQCEIVRRLESLLKIAEESKNRLAAASKHSDNLQQTILAKAFRGELVPTEAELARREGREYEPASVLLERIKAARISDTKPSRMKRSMRKASAHV